MSTRRLVLGTFNDGVTIGLRVSLPGYDALTDNSSDAGKFSFDSEWTDILPVHQVALSSRQLNISQPPAFVSTANGWKIDWPSLGYKPFIELHLISSGLLWDDWTSASEFASWNSGHRGRIHNSVPSSCYVTGGSSGDQMLSIVYKAALPVP